MAGSFSVHTAEYLAVCEGTRLAHSCGIQNWVIESDTINVVRAINSSSARALGASVIEDIKEVVLNDCSKVCYGSRDGNLLIHYLISFAFLNNCDLLWIDSVPRFFRSLIRANSCK